MKKIIAWKKASRKTEEKELKSIFVEKYTQEYWNEKRGLLKTEKKQMLFLVLTSK